MKRYLSFQGSVYYPSGGMDDFVGDFDSLEEAKQAAVAAAGEDGYTEPDVWRFLWAHVWDSVERKEAWKNP